MPISCTSQSTGILVNITHNTVPVTIDARRWTRILSHYREPSWGRSVAELTITALALVALWSTAWFAFSQGHWWVSMLMTVPAAGFLIGEVTSKMRLRFCNLATAASDHGRDVAKPRGCSTPQGGDENRFFFAEMMGADSPPVSAASLANRSAFNRAVFSTTARLAASYSAMAFAPSIA